MPRCTLKRGFSYSWWDLGARKNHLCTPDSGTQLILVPRCYTDERRFRAQIGMVSRISVCWRKPSENVAFAMEVQHKKKADIR